MSKKDTNPLIHSLMRLRKRYCGGVSAACMTTNTRMAKDNAEFQKLIRDVEALIAERDEARRSYCWSSAGGDEYKAHNVAQGKNWDCFNV